MLPKKFKQRCKKFVPDFEEFENYYKIPQSIAIRVNTNKISTKDFLKMTKLKLKKVPWYSDGFFVEKGKAAFVTNTLEYFLGYIYLQDAASMIPPLLLDVTEKDNILDLTAAPGSKTTQISQMMNNKGCVIANDNSFERIKALRGNLNKLGCKNVAVVRNDVRNFPDCTFDKIQLDAPCSLEGSMRKYFIKWSEGTIRNFASIQKKMIDRAWNLLSPGGTLIYSTCTYAPEENEGVVQHLINNNSDAKLEKIDIKGLNYHQGLEEFRDTTYDSILKKTARVYIHDYNTCGFYISKITKRK